MPVPPLVVFNSPLTALSLLILIAPNTGLPLSLGTVSTWNALPGWVAYNAPLPPPRMTPLLLKLPAPVPPKATLRVPVLMMLAEIFGMSLLLRARPLITRPLESTDTLA